MPENGRFTAPRIAGVIHKAVSWITGTRIVVNKVALGNSEQRVIK
jgi:hypothetical protein